MLRSFNWLIIFAIATTICVSPLAKGLEIANSELATIDTVDVSMALSPLVSTISDHFKLSMKESIKKNEDIKNSDGMIQWIEFIWSHPTHSSINDELNLLKSNHEYQMYTVLYIAHMMREIINELPDNTDNKHVIIDAMSSKLKIKLVHLEDYLSSNDPDPIDIHTLLNEQLEQLKNSESACALPTHTSSRYHYIHQTRPMRHYYQPQYHLQPYMLYNQHYQPSEQIFMDKFKRKPNLKKCAKFLLSFVRIAASAVCIAHGLPISF